MTAPARAFLREAGPGPAVVCIHASASSSGQWRPLMDRLAGRYRTLAGDLYGSGQSPPWPGDRPLSLADERTLLAPAFEAAGGRFHLVGPSYGGAVALEAARAEPGRVASLVLFEPVLFSLLAAEDPAQPAVREIAAVRADSVAALDVPVLCLTGSESPASSRGVTRLLAKTLPRVTVIEIEGVGHMGPITHPDRINALIERFLDAGGAALAGAE